MPRTGASRLVIDTSVAFAAGGEYATFPLSIHCRNFLLVVFRKHFSVVMSPDIESEWKEHGSPFALDWLTSMRQKDRVYKVTPPDYEALQVKIEGCAKGPAQLRHMLEDLHLIEAALVTDRTVVSGDREVQHLFARATTDVKELRNIVWVDANEEGVVAWARGGAMCTKELQLATLAKNIS